MPVVVDSVVLVSLVVVPDVCVVPKETNMLLVGLGINSSLFGADDFLSGKTKLSNIS